MKDEKCVRSKEFKVLGKYFLQFITLRKVKKKCNDKNEKIMIGKVLTKDDLKKKKKEQ